MIHWEDISTLGTVSFKRRLEHLLTRGYFSTQRTGNYSLILRGRRFNYRLNGQELFLTDWRDAQNLANYFKEDYVYTSSLSPSIVIDISFRREK